MPSEPRIPTEPTLEELSAYLDHELNDDARLRVAEHVAGCADCQARLDGLRQTAYAIRALPMETPRRTFTIPAKRRESLRWAPVAGWIGGVAAAMLIIVVGVTHLPLNGPGSTASTGTISGGLGQGNAPQSNKGAAAPAAPTGNVTLDGQQAFAARDAVTVIDPRNNARRLSLMIGAAAYPSDGFILVTGTLSGDPSSNVGQVRLALRRGSYGVALPMPQQTFANSDSVGFGGNYSIAVLRLPNPVPGSYTVVATWTATDGSGATLFAEVPVTIR